MYGKVSGTMTEETPFNPCSKKGEVRAKIATSLINEWKAGALTAMIARAADLDVDGFDVFIPADAVGTLKNHFHAAGVNAGSRETWEIARIEAGRPEWGVDMDDSTLPQEANFDELGAISYTKGCYIGQETVARVHFRGHVNRFLRRLRFVTRPAPPKGVDELTAREREILRLIVAGLSNAEIGSELYISDTTVKTHVTHILQKLDLRDRVQAVVLAYETGLFDLRQP